jgi:hypothetical protein
LGATEQDPRIRQDVPDPAAQGLNLDNDGQGFPQLTLSEQVPLEGLQLFHGLLEQGLAAVLGLAFLLRNLSFGLFPDSRHLLLGLLLQVGDLAIDLLHEGLGLGWQVCQEPLQDPLGLGRGPFRLRTGAVRSLRPSLASEIERSA